MEDMRAYVIHHRTGLLRRSDMGFSSSPPVDQEPEPTNRCNAGRWPNLFCATAAAQTRAARGQAKPLHIALRCRYQDSMPKKSSGDLSRAVPCALAASMLRVAPPSLIEPRRPAHVLAATTRFGRSRRGPSRFQSVAPQKLCITAAWSWMENLKS